MKEFIIILSVLILTFVPNVLFKNFLNDSGQDILNILESMKGDIANSSAIDEAKSRKLDESFKKNEKKWILIVDHEILDEIENNIGDCIAFYNGNEEKDFNASYTRIKNNIEDLAKREEVSLTNIF